MCIVFKFEPSVAQALVTETMAREIGAQYRGRKRGARKNIVYAVSYEIYYHVSGGHQINHNLWLVR